MKVLNKITVVQKRKTAEHTKTERVVSRTKSNSQTTREKNEINKKNIECKPFQLCETCVCVCVCANPFQAPFRHFILGLIHRYVLRDQKAQLIEK